jgi:predicted AAA+ superfamily ATPase
MAPSNRDRLNAMFELIAPVLDEFLCAHLGDGWFDLFLSRERSNGSGLTFYRNDPAVQLRVLFDEFPRIKGVLRHVHRSYAAELRDARNSWAHNNPFTAEDAYRALDTGERLLAAIGAADVADKVGELRRNLLRVSAEQTDKRVLKESINAPASQGLKPWREVLRPHDDVATGNFQASEFAADLYKVALGGATGDYADPRQFFSRTYLTEGLRDLIQRSLARLNGDPNASPVVNLQTNFGGGKTHSMLTLWHLAAGLPLDAYSQEVQELLSAASYDPTRSCRRVALVGNHIAPTGSTKPDGTQVNTLWGEMAWQLGGKEAYELVADADASRTAPGEALHDLLALYSPAVILIDEWVAYARQLYDRSDLPAGSFDTQFTFAQALTEAVKATPGVMLAISIPASYDGSGEPAAGSAEEVGGAHGLEALSRLQNVVRRIAAQWRPASADESYHIVRQRLFQQPDADALAAINATARAFVEFYRANGSEFPSEARNATYEERIKQTYPIHPELFDTLYKDWSSLERFQRTRGVLRLMNAVIHALWAGDDQSALILPGSVPLSVSSVNSELTSYLPDSWKSVIDTDVDGPHSEPWRIDTDKPLLGTRSTTKRLARAIFVAAAPSIGLPQKGLELPRILLGAATPGDVVGNFHTALHNLSDRATYLYSASGRYWYDLHANITRRAKDSAERLHVEDVWAEVAKRLATTDRLRGDFARIHVCPEDSVDIFDTDEARLVVLHPRFSHHKSDKASAAAAFAQQATERHGSGLRTYRNMIVFLAPDKTTLEELDAAVRDYLGWNSVVADATDLDLTENQKQQAVERRATADKTATARLDLTYTWALFPDQDRGDQPFEITALKVEPSSLALAERVSRKLRTEDRLRTRQAASNTRRTLDQFPQLWQAGNIRLGELWELYARYPYLPRLTNEQVLIDGASDVMALVAWDGEAFAWADSVDEDGRYRGLVLPSDSRPPMLTSTSLLVKPAVALAQRDADDAAAAEKLAQSGGGSAASTPRSAPTPASPESPPKPPAKTHFFGSKTLSSDRYAMDFKSINDEILAHLVKEHGAKLTVRIEIEAELADGFGDATARTVSENARTLKFDQQGFE